jgi:proteasome component ECM29
MGPFSPPVWSFELTAFRSVVLPVAALLDQYKATESLVLRQVDLSFIQHSIDRIDPVDRCDLIPKVFKGLAKDGRSASAPTIFNVLLRLLQDIKLPSRGSKEDAILKETLGLSDSEDAQFAADWLGKILLLKLSPGGQPSDQSTQTFNPALTKRDLEFLRPNQPDFSKPYSQLPQLRLTVINLLASGAFDDRERFLPALFAASSTDSRVSSIGEDLLKRSKVSLEDKELVESLFDAHSRLPASYRTRILGLLAKSAISTTMGEKVWNVITLDFGVLGPESQSQAGGSHLVPTSGLEKTKLHKALFQYVTWVARIGPSKGTFTIGPKIVDKMENYIVDQGWPIPMKTSVDDIALRSLAYETIGLVAGASPNLTLQERLSVAGWLFRSLSEDPTPEVVVNIDGALSSLTHLFPPSTERGTTGMGALRTLLLRYMTLPEEAPAVRSSRHAAVKWANVTLDFSDFRARWIDILAIGGRRDERSDVVEEGQKGLDPWTYYAHTSEQVDLPDWMTLSKAFFGSNISPILSDSWMGISHDERVSVFQNFTGDSIWAFPVAIKYCKQLLLLGGIKGFKIESDWIRRLEALVKTEIDTRTQIRQYLAELDDSHTTFLLKVCLDGMLHENSAVAIESARCMAEIAGLGSGSALAYVADRAKDVLFLLKSNNSELRGLAAKVVGILAPHPANSDQHVKGIIENILEIAAPWATAVGSQMNAMEGALAAFGYVAARAAYYGRGGLLSGVAYPTNLLLEPNLATSLQESVLDLFTQIWTAGLGVPKAEGDFPVSKIVGSLETKAKKGNERAISALGRLALALDDRDEDVTENSWEDGVVGSVLGVLFKLFDIKQAEIHFTVGEAITAAIARWDSDFVRLTLDVQPATDSYRKSKRTNRITAVLNKLLTDCKATKPSLLKASGIWLFCIVQYCSHAEEVQSRLREVQVAFMRLLSARDELVQETASRGLSLVYEKGDSALKEDLVRDLVSSFTGSGPKLKVDQETELFEPGALPTGEGKSITSYKDIVNLASEVGDQSLVYKFMSLATNAATWSARSAFGRFGLSNILSDSDVDPKLYPKLYRYRFDPNPNVQRSMEDIWKALVKDSNAVLETHFDAIVTDLLKSVLGKEWRVREASCAAISDLVQGRPFQKYEKYYRDIWTSAMKVLDDVKGTVRQAALKLCMGLSNTLVRQMEESGASAGAQAMTKEALPFLLSQNGIESTVEDVKILSTITVMKITKSGGKAIRPFIAELVPQLLGLLSTIEPEQINYRYQRAGEENRDKIDKLRAAIVNQSPISEAIDNCLRQVDSEVMIELVPKLEATIKTAIGMPTKIGCARVLSTLFTRHAQDVEASSARLLQLMEKQILDKNDEVSQGYARAAAYMMRVGPESTKERFLNRLVEIYFGSEDEVRRQKVADAVLAVSKISPDQFSALESFILPFAYLGSHDTDEYTCKAFGEVWSQHSGSNRTVARYLVEILSLSDKSLAAPRWALQHTGALTVASSIIAVSNASDIGGQISDTNLKAIWPVFDKALAMKTFPKKEKLLGAFSVFVSKGTSLWKGDSQIAAQQKKIALREARRNNEAYRVYAFKCLWQFAEGREDLDLLDDITAIVTPYMDELKDEDKMEIDSKNDTITSTASNGLEAIARGYNRPKMEKDSLAVLDEIFRPLKPYLSHIKFGAIKRKIWYKCVTDLMEAAKPSQPGINNKGLLLIYFTSLEIELVDVGTEGQRIARAKAAIAVLKAKENGVFGIIDAVDMEQAKSTVKKALEVERSLDVQRLLRDLLQKL